MLLHIFFNRWRCGICIHDTWLICGEHMKKRRGLILSPINEITESKMRERRMTLRRFPLHLYITNKTLIRLYLHIHKHTLILVPVADWWQTTWASPSRESHFFCHSSIPSPHERLWSFSLLLHFLCKDPTWIFCGRCVLVLWGVEVCSSVLTSAASRRERLEKMNTSKYCKGSRVCWGHPETSHHTWANKSLLNTKFHYFPRVASIWGLQRKLEINSDIVLPEVPDRSEAIS